MLTRTYLCSGTKREDHRSYGHRYMRPYRSAGRSSRERKLGTASTKEVTAYDRKEWGSLEIVLSAGDILCNNCKLASGSYVVERDLLACKISIGNSRQRRNAQIWPPWRGKKQKTGEVISK
jgi:hypothetical protein